jgi:hypothetical protein
MSVATNLGAVTTPADSADAQTSVDIEEVLRREHELIQDWRKRSCRHPKEEGQNQNYTGLAFSGGGIRSATFNLGLLQGLAREGCLKQIDYISSVSGGSYINSWLCSWIHRKGFNSVDQALRDDGSQDLQEKRFQEQREVTHLRQYSNYLTPQRGLLSGDTWAAIAGYCVRLLPNAAFVLLVVSAVLLGPIAVRDLMQAAGKTDTVLPLISLIISGLFLLGFPARFYFGSEARFDAGLARQISLHLVSAAIITAVVLVAIPSRVTGHSWGPLVTAFLITLVCQLGFYWQVSGEQPTNLSDLNVVISMVSATCVGTTLLWVPIQRLRLLEQSQELNLALAVSIGPLLIIFIYLVVGSIYMVGLPLDDDLQEWINRIWGSTALYSLLWAGIATISLVLPSSLRTLAPWWHTLGTRVPALQELGPRSGAVTAALGWLVTTGLGIASGYSRRTGAPSAAESVATPLRMRRKRAARRNALMESAAGATPGVFALGLLCGLSLIYNHVLHSAGELVVVLFGSAFLGWTLGRIIDINRLSLHNLYRFRLVECYLCLGGISNPHKLPLRSLRYSGQMSGAQPNEPPTSPFEGPYPLINSALNVTKRGDLSVQKKRALNFIFSPLYCGFNHFEDIEGASTKRVVSQENLAPFAYRPSTLFARVDESPLTLGAAMAISGAAQSPNQGEHSSPAVAFLLTLANVRLGWWIGNPRHTKTWRSGSPKNGFWCLLQELLGEANDRQKYVYLSDGAHFENLGIYELVRRRCKLIIASDVDMDPRYDFADLMSAIERCEVDFGAKITIDTDPLLPGGKSGYCRSPFVVGNIVYKELGDKREQGILIYIKPTVARDNSAFVKDYDRHNKAFPHDPTVNQWFDEAQFEAYRLLGLESIEATLSALHDSAPPWWVGTPEEWKSVAESARKLLTPSSPRKLKRTG